MKRCDPQVIIVECKQSRSDFLRDRQRLDALLLLREHLEGIRRSIEEHRIKSEEPHLRRAGTSLFDELEGWDFHASRLPAYRKVVRRLSKIDQKLYGQTKFFMMSRYRLANQMFIAAPPGMIRPSELPRGWGLLEPIEGTMELADSMSWQEMPPPLHTVVKAMPHNTLPARQLRWLRNIAVAASRTQAPIVSMDSPAETLLAASQP